MILQDIKETKRYGHTHTHTVGRTDGQRENSIPTHKDSLRGYNYVELESSMLHAKIMGHPVLEKKIVKGVYHMWAWRPSWSCDQHHVIRISIPFT